MAVIANYVVGIPSLIENDISGILIPANDPYLMASKVLSLIQSKELCIKLGTVARNLA